MGQDRTIAAPRLLGDRHGSWVAGLLSAVLLVASVLLGLVVAPAGAQTSDDALSTRGDARFHGSTSATPLNAPLVDIAVTPTGDGYWLLGGDGGVFTFGDAAFHGSTGGMALNEPVVGITADPQGRGYWTVASDGGVFSFGVPFHGSMGGHPLNQEVVAMAATPTGNGYWLVAADGGVFTFGDARFLGSAADRLLDHAVVDIAAHPDGQGYWLLVADGEVLGFGVDAPRDAPVRLLGGDRAMSISAHPDGTGYFIATRQGEVHTGGRATSYGDRTDAELQTVAIAATGSGLGYWLVHAPPPDPVAISSFTTPLVPGQRRNHNIHLAADYIDGSVIAPGESFSLSRTIGRRTPGRGFQGNGFINAEGEIESVIGGGISQMGTTFLNAAWFAGIRLDDFRQHTIYFPRYPMCREATLAWGILDVVVTNNSPYDITVDTSYTSSSVTVSMISRPWAEVSTWTGEPFNIEGPGGAFSVRCGRTVTYPDGSTSDDAYSWRYNEGYRG